MQASIKCNMLNKQCDRVECCFLSSLCLNLNQGADIDIHISAKKKYCSSTNHRAFHFYFQNWTITTTSRKANKMNKKAEQEQEQESKSLSPLLYTKVLLTQSFLFSLFKESPDSGNEEHKLIYSSSLLPSSRFLPSLVWQIGFIIVGWLAGWFYILFDTFFQA